MPLGRLLIVLGLVLVVAGLLLTYTNIFSSLKLGRLPGDISIKRESFSFYFPVTTCILVSLVLTLIVYLLRK
jgi:Protein of unknown function (DUF2905)